MKFAQTNLGPRQNSHFLNCQHQLSLAEIIIVAVPTPIDHSKMPDLSALEEASSIVGRHMTAGTTVVFESTVYPGATEEICIPILRKESDLRWKRDFIRL